MAKNKRQIALSILDGGAGFEVEAAQHLRALRQVSSRLVQNKEDAEDLVQDTFVNAFKFSAQFRPGTNLKAWLMTILRNLGRNHRRAASREQTYVAPHQVDDAIRVDAGPAASPEHQLLSRLLEPQLKAALQSMPRPLRRAVWLRDVDELSYAEIAHREGIPVGTVMSRIARGRRVLHARLMELTKKRAGIRRSVSRP